MHNIKKYINNNLLKNNNIIYYGDILYEIYSYFIVIEDK